MARGWYKIVASWLTAGLLTTSSASAAWPDTPRVSRSPDDFSTKASLDYAVDYSPTMSAPTVTTARRKNSQSPPQVAMPAAPMLQDYGGSKPRAGSILAKQVPKWQEKPPTASNVRRAAYDSAPAESVPRGTPLPPSVSRHPQSPMFDDIQYQYTGEPACTDCGPYAAGCDDVLYVRGEYLLWWVQGDRTPPLVTTSPPGTAREDAGVLFRQGTEIIYGDEGINGEARSGIRLTAGRQWDDESRIEAEWFALADASETYTGAADGSNILGRPFFNLQTFEFDAYLFAYPGEIVGALNIESESKFQGAGVMMTRKLGYLERGGRNSRFDFLYGFRYLRLEESMNFTDSATSIDPAGPVPVGTSVLTRDSFATANDFYGLNIGVGTETRNDRWFFSSLWRLGIGSRSESVDINGSTTAVFPGNAPMEFAGGLLAMPSNIGTYERNKFALVPQLEMKLGYDYSESVRFTVGYDLLFWSRAVRPGEQIDAFINPSQASGQPLVGSVGPNFNFVESDIWIQGLSIGGEWRF